MAKQLTEHAIYKPQPGASGIAAYMNCLKDAKALRKLGHTATFGWDEERGGYVLMAD